MLHSKNFVDLSGKTFGRLTVIDLKSSGKKTFWNCICVCENNISVEAYNLKSGHTISCGCFRSETTKKNKTIHGFRHHALYDVWCHIKDRCLNKNNPAYHNYGGRGITICEEWVADANVFISWALLNGWQEGLDTDRIDNNKGYCPSNCRFVTRKINGFNKRTTAFIEYNGKRMTTDEITNQFQISGLLVLRRIRDFKWDVEKALFTKPRRNRALKEDAKMNNYSSGNLRAS